MIIIISNLTRISESTELIRRSSAHKVCVCQCVCVCSCVRAYERAWVRAPYVCACACVRACVSVCVCYARTRFAVVKAYQNNPVADLVLLVLMTQLIGLTASTIPT